MSVVYIASPFSHDSFFVRVWRFICVCVFAAKRMRAGEVVFSPIAHSFSIELFGMWRRQGFDFWMAQDLPILERSSKLVVLMLKGWDKSKGVAREIAKAISLGIPVEYAKP